MSLILKRAAGHRRSGEWRDDDDDVLADGVVVGRIMKAAAVPAGISLMWTLDFGHHGAEHTMRDRTLITTGIVGAVVAAVCCVTPLLAILFGALGLTALYSFKTLVEEDTDRILGAHLVGPHAEEVINLFGLAIRHVRDRAHPMTSQALNSLRDHWPEYLIEAAGLGLFMISAGAIATLLEYPQSTIHHAIADPLLRRALMGLAMGATLAGLVYSPWGRQSGAHFNPVVTLTFFRLGKVAAWDAVFYIVAQLAGGLAGVLLLFVVIGEAFGRPPVEFVVTVPGPAGQLAAFAAELFTSFGLMLTVLYTTNRVALMRYTGLFAALLLALYITFESPLSGTSMNPARTVASALPSGAWQGLWIYLVAPLIGMLAAADAYRLLTGRSNVMCAKLNHITHRRCIFIRCWFKEHAGAAPPLAAQQSQHGGTGE